MESSDLSTRLTPDRLHPASAAREVVTGTSRKDAETRNRRRPASEAEEHTEAEPGDEQHQIDSLA
ncbi:MAG: hypothetical protein LAO24_03125 [Acidobacteriia bacterium]|nr:hypothetical protein [Terriglobia bacterium]